MAANPAYEALVQRFARRARVENAMAILHWDQAVMMPSGSAESRAEDVAALALIAHEMLADPATAEALEAARAGDGLHPWEAANLREMGRLHARATALPARLVGELSAAASRTEMAWREARRAADFARLSPHLERLVALVREEAACLAAATGLSPYDALLDGYDEGRRSDEVQRIFDDLSGFLPPLLDAVLERQAAQRRPLVPQGPFDDARQAALGAQIMRLLGFDMSRGRLDTSDHPFSGGTPDDTRITTRFDPAEPLSSLMAVIHETGHALYEQNLPAAWRAQPVGRSLGMTIHESQSLLYEKQVGRGRPFLAFIAPTLAQTLGADPAFEADNLLNLARRVDRGLIRVDADEVSYPLHVILRFRLERAMVEGALEIADLPAAWNEGMETLLGRRPENDRVGCLQDIHWPSGAFGYFPTYTLGALAAAQLYRAAREAVPGMEEAIGLGDGTPLLGWLKENVHSIGRSVTPSTLIERATGRPLDAEAFKLHLTERYLENA
jgi:carboxypeptidase Taq